MLGFMYYKMFIKYKNMLHVLTSKFKREKNVINYIIIIIAVIIKAGNGEMLGCMYKFFVSGINDALKLTDLIQVQIYIIIMKLLYCYY